VRALIRSIACLVGLALLFLALLSSRPDRIVLKDDCLLRVRGWLPAEKSAGKSQYVIAPRKNRLAHFCMPRGRCSVLIFICTTDGSILWEIEIAGQTLQSVNCILEAGWIDDSRVYVEAHISPSLGKYFEVPVDQGQIRAYEGSSFTWNAGKTHLAYVRNPPHFGPPSSALSTVFIGEREVGEIPNTRSCKLSWPEENRLMIVLRGGDGATDQSPRTFTYVPEG